MKPKHPMQPVYYDFDGIIRFKHNKIVRFLLDHGKFDMNDLARMDFTDEDRAQFAQLIGYSVGGWGTLSYVGDKEYTKAQKMVSKLDGKEETQ